MDASKLLILLPTYNEAGNVPSIISAIRAAVPQARILVVDDNSPDGTADVVRGLAQHHPQLRLLMRQGKEGLGKAYLHAFAEALQEKGIEAVLMMDADHSHDPAYIRPMLKRLDSADVVTGSRYVRGGGTEGWERWRMLLSRFGNRYCGLVTGMPIADATAGFNMLRTDMLRRIDLGALDSSGYAFQMELKYLLWKAGARHAEVPIIFKKRREGESKLSNHIIAEGLLAPWKMRFKQK